MMKKLLLALLLASSAWAQTNPVTAAFPGAVVTDDQLTYQDDFGSTTLSSSVGASDLTIFITSAAGFLEPSVIAVCPVGECSSGNYANAELMFVTGISGTTLTISATGRELGQDCIGSATGKTFANGSVVELVPSSCAHNRLAAEIKAIETALGANLANVVEVADFDTEAELEALLTDVTNLIVSTEIDTVAELEALAGAVNLITSTEIDTIAELEALLGAVNVLLSTELDTSAELAGILTDETGTGLAVFNVAPNLQGVINGTGTPVDDDDCTGQQGQYWYDSTDGRFEFCNANSGAPDVPGAGGGGGASQLSDLSDVNTSTPTNRNALLADGVDWESRPIIEADISDLQSYLLSEVNNLGAAVTWANVPDANVTQSSVTQHVAAIDHDSLLNFSATKHIDHAASATSAFVQDGGVTTLTCGAANQGRMQIMDDGTLQVCDGAVTSVQQTFTPGAHTVEANNLSSVVTWANVPDANITSSSVTQHEIPLEGVLDLQDLQGAVTDAQVPDTITVDLATLATTATTANAGDSATAFFSVGEIEDARVVDTITASNYLPLAGGTLTGQLVTDNLGIELEDSDTNPACAAGNYNIYADLSETTLKKCVNGAVTDLDTTAAGSGDAVTVNSVVVDTTADLDDTATVEWTLVDGGAGGPDQARASIVANSVGPTQIDETAAYDFTGGLSASRSTFPAFLAERDGIGVGNQISSALEVKTTSTVDIVDGFGTGLTFSWTDDTATTSNHTAINAVRAGADDTTDLVFRTSAAGTLAERMRIKSDGSVEIGTGGTTPWNVTGFTDDVAPSAPGAANQFTFYFDRTSGFPSYILNGGTAQTIATLAGTQTFTNKTLTTPTIGSFTNAGHDHSNAAGGGNVPFTSLSGSATDAQIPNTITVDLATVATTANSGDSATAFFSSGEIADAQIVDTLTASNYLPLAGGTLTGQLVADNLGVEFVDSDTNPTCAAGNYNVFADLSETTLKKCVNGVVTDLDTGGALGADAVGTTELDDDANTPVAGSIVIVETGAASFDYIAQNAGTDVTADLEEEGQINATAVTGNAADDQVILGSGASAAAYATIPNCVTGSMLTYTQATNTFGCESDDAGAGAAANREKSFAAATTMTITDAEHELGNSAFVYACWDNATDPAAITPKSVTKNTTTFAITFTFEPAATGTCVVNGSGGTGTTVDDTEMTAETFGDFTCTGAEDGCTLNTDSVAANEIATDGVGSAEIAAGAVGTDELAVQHKTEQFCFSLFDPASDLTTDMDIPSIWMNIARAITLTQVTCESDSGTATINLQRDDGTPANILSSDLTCTTTPANGTIAAAEDNIAVDEEIDFLLQTSPAGTNRVNVCTKYTVD